MMQSESQAPQLEQEVSILLQSGNYEEAGTRITLAFRMELRRFFRRMLGCTEEEDMAQEVCCAIIKAVPKFQVVPDATIRSWVFSIAHHHLQSRFRSRYRAREQPIERSPPDWQGLRSQKGSALDSELDRKRRLQNVNWALAQLPEEDRVLLVLRAQQNMSFKELGEVVGLSEGAAKMRHQRAKEMCRELVQSLPRGSASTS